MCGYLIMQGLDSLARVSGLPATLGGRVWADSGIDLGGFFYDYLVDGQSVVGIAFHTFSPLSVDDFALGYFEGDKRFVQISSNCIGIFFEVKNIEKYNDGLLSLTVVQNFGGVMMAKCDNGYGIYIEIT